MKTFLCACMFAAHITEISASTGNSLRWPLRVGLPGGHHCDNFWPSPTETLEVAEIYKKDHTVRRIPQYVRNSGLQDGSSHSSSVRRRGTKGTIGGGFSLDSESRRDVLSSS